MTEATPLAHLRTLIEQHIETEVGGPNASYCWFCHRDYNGVEGPQEEHASDCWMIQVRALLTDLEAAQPTENKDDVSRVATGATMPGTGSTAASNEAVPPTAKELHLMDLYAALGVQWGGDPFPVIARMRKSVAGEAVASRPADECDLRAAIVLRPSHLGGVGCFTTAPIANGAAVDGLFADHDWLFVAGEAEALPEALCHYIVLTTGGYYRPRDFRAMSVGWYLNHSDAPNLRVDGEDHWFACRAIAANEELAVDYGTLDADVDNRIFPAVASRPNPELDELAAIRALCIDAGMIEPSTTLDYLRGVFYRLRKAVASRPAAQEEILAQVNQALTRAGSRSLIGTKDGRIVATTIEEVVEFAAAPAVEGARQEHHENSTETSAPMVLASADPARDVADRLAHAAVVATSDRGDAASLDRVVGVSGGREESTWQHGTAHGPFCARNCVCGLGQGQVAGGREDALDLEPIKKTLASCARGYPYRRWIHGELNYRTAKADCALLIAEIERLRDALHGRPAEPGAQTTPTKGEA